MVDLHCCLVCNMNQCARAIVILAVVLSSTGADEVDSKNNTSTTTIKWDHSTSTTKWKHPSSTTKQSTTTTVFKQPTANTQSWKLTSTIKEDKKRTTPTITASWKKSTTTKAPPINRVSSYVSFNHGTVAVASISGIDARNGRLSSMDGIKIYPPVDPSMVKTDNKGNFIFKSVNGKMPAPITITKQGDGVSGTIRILPGSVSVSSSATSSSKSGPATAVASYNPWPMPYVKPIVNDIYFPSFPTFPSILDPVYDTRIPEPIFNTRIPDPFAYMRIPEPTFHSRMQDPWLSKDRYKQKQSNRDILKRNWNYPSFNPFFNYW